MILERHDDARFLGRGNALFDRVDAPLEGVFVGMPWQRRLGTPGRHQLIKGLDRIPSPRVEPNTGNTEL
jgi:hypothetical protein